MNKLAIMILLLVQPFASVNAQNSNVAEMAITVSVPAVALIDFKGSDQLIRFKSPNQVEQIITPNTSNDIWLNYSSIVKAGSTNYITVHISSGNLPPETSLSLQIEDDIGSGAGHIGTPSTQITLSRYPQNIITNIGSCYTGKGIEKGHKLTYSWNNIDDYYQSPLSMKDFVITVTYTITSTE